MGTGGEDLFEWGKIVFVWGVEGMGLGCLRGCLLRGMNCSYELFV